GGLCLHEIVTRIWSTATRGLARSPTPNKFCLNRIGDDEHLPARAFGQSVTMRLHFAYGVFDIGAVQGVCAAGDIHRLGAVERIETEWGWDRTVRTPQSVHRPTCFVVRWRWVQYSAQHPACHETGISMEYRLENGANLFG